MKRMLINATQEEELRMAMVDGQSLYDLNIELPAAERKKANIYKGQITRIEPSLEAAFVNYGAERHGFLPLKEISSEYFVANANSGKTNIKDVLREGQDIVVQIDKEERGNKGAALTTFVSLAGRFIVLKPNKPRSGGVSRRIVGDERDLARKSLRDVEVPEGMSVILRTAGIERTGEDLTWDMENLLSVWEAIKKVVVERPSPFLIYRESNAVVRALRDYLTNEIGEILIDDEATYTEAKEFVEQVMPHNLRKLKHYTDPVPLFTRYQIDSQIESAFAHQVNLPSGGSLVIDHTEALVSIDINSARATKGGDIEATALNTNLESADEIARQLRLRDLGGLIVIDFIDMGPQRNQREVENRLRDAVRQDRARVQLSKISRFGLLEMSRQRLRPSLGESSYLVCPRCSGIGNIRSVESLALAILRLIGEEARKERTAKVIAQLPIEVATYLLNEKREWVQSLESRHDTQVILVANPVLETPHYQVRRVRDDQVDLPENVGNSFMLAESEDEPEITQTMQDKKPAELAAVTTVVATTPAPIRQEPVQETASAPGLFSRIAGFFGGASNEEQQAEKRPARNSSRSQSDSRKRGGQRNKKRSDGQRQNNRKGSQRSSAKTPKKRAKKTAGKESERKTDRKPTQPDKAAQEEQQGDNRQTANKRRSRGGRRRRRGPESAENTENSAPEKQSDQQQSEQQSSQPTADKKPARKPRQPRRSADSSNRSADSPKAVDSVEKVDGPTNNDATTSDTQAKKAPTRRQPRKKVAEAKQAEQPEAARSEGEQAAANIEAPKPAAAPVLTQVATKKPAADIPAIVRPTPTAKPNVEKVATPLTQVQTIKPEAKPRSVPRVKPSKPPGYEDTQPELAVVKQPARAPKPARSSAAKPTKPVAVKDSGNGEGVPAPAPKPKVSVVQEKPTQAEKPAGKLLPWDKDKPAPLDKD